MSGLVMAVAAGQAPPLAWPSFGSCLEYHPMATHAVARAPCDPRHFEIEPQRRERSRALCHRHAHALLGPRFDLVASTPTLRLYRVAHRRVAIDWVVRERPERAHLRHARRVQLAVRMTVHNEIRVH
eukprot:CAMPEP_0181236998 /NCGR_PEP_ID=MMETSP1096-20121128/38506_1 /TAXON_ID=156174 ORGANISM="Chrysochromulina ericina, Strain CCMP281" /NCGR_SAMPLE_ID=MMETSP1096 /ASSEMBLY_ACC=CAM_ASM_000453 /LENGTH=126 /DNA_ID=CAMNT_0023332279 /DNA_START=173 /DNA_END=554 /DNA_ORIENTATION=+